MTTLNELIIENVKNFIKEFGHAPTYTASAPGRINTIGEHTDYNEGLSLATGINRWVLVSIKERDDTSIIVHSGNYNKKISFLVGELVNGKDKWHPIVSGIIAILKKNHGIEKGCEIYIWGNVPLGSGVSSSAAIEVALLNAFRSLYQLTFSDEQLVLYCQQTEHQYLGVKSGLLDQYTSQFSSEKDLILLDFRSVSHEPIPVNFKGYQWILVNTMVNRELSGSKYSERVDETQEAFSIIQKKHPELQHFREVQVKHLEAITDERLRRRLKHYVEENARVYNFISALQKRDFKQAGALLTASHLSLQHYYEVSCEELDFLAEKALSIEGCLGSRMMGGGFGGCTINLVEESETENFCKKITTFYQYTFNIVPEINIYQTVNGAQVVNHTITFLKK